MSIRIQNNTLRLGEAVTVTFQRTLRIPDDGKTYPLPPGLGGFPLRRVQDYAERVPTAWRDKGGIFLPMYQREAMWLAFSCPHHKPRALKVGVGKVCAITGKPWRETLRRRKQDYVVVPKQPWLDGIYAGKGKIRQFVAMPLGAGYTVEGQITGKEEHGGVQLKVFEPKPGLFPDKPPAIRARARAFGSAAPAAAAPMPLSCASLAEDCATLGKDRGGTMGLAAGGSMRQKIYPDPHGHNTWDASNTARVFVHLCNAQLWREITGEPPPSTPVTAKEYARHGLPWFDLYDENAGTVKGSGKLKKVKSVKELDADKFGIPMQDDSSVMVQTVKKLWSAAKGVVVQDGQW